MRILAARWLIVVVMVLSAAAAAHAEDSCPCPHPEMWRPTAATLKQILWDHGKWLKKEGWKSPASPGKAILCRADLSDADLAGAELSRANLWKANLAGPGQCNEATVEPANLKKAQLRNADLRGSQLCWVDLSEADLSEAKLQNATLFHADLTGADLWRANLSGADLSWAKLRGANLGAAILHGAYLAETDLQDARLRRAELEHACYAAATAPARGSLAGMQGLDSTWFSEGEESGLVQLREQLQGAGLRALERKATYAVERNQTRHLFHFRAQPNQTDPTQADPAEGCEPRGAENQVQEQIRWDEPLKLVERGLRMVFLEWPVAYGLYPERALVILAVSIGVFALVYVVPLRRVGDKGGVYRIWPKERLDWGTGGRAEWSEQAKVEHLRPSRFGAALGRATQLSLLSAFHLGWREVNVGNWIARVQPSEYTLRATGWVRVVAGFQSLISVYLLALWALTYFGRPFQ